MGAQDYYNQLSAGMNFTPSSGVKFKSGEIENTGKSLTHTGDTVSSLSNRTGQIDLGWPGYGISGRDAGHGHTQARTDHTSTLKVAREVLDSWQSALKTADDRYTAAEAANQKPPPGGPEIPGPGGIPNLTPADLKTPKIPDPKLPDPKLTDPKLTDPKLTDPKLTDPKLTDPKLNDPKLNDPRLTDPKLNTPDLKNPDLKNPDLKMPDTSGLDPSKTNLGDKLNMPDPTKTGLSNFDPSSLKTPTVGTPEGGNTRIDPGRLPGLNPAGSVSGMGPNGSLPGGLAGKLGSGMGGMGGAPFLPMGGMGGGGGEQEKEQSSQYDLRQDDEGVWGFDDDVAPDVVRHLEA
ncbi:hypothetical protein ACIBHX_08765 [Nonomuraea sp. NPDC050536]|uniref:hypothetical protein n=1 Tax=Nonomuraea sp. NPDC050536 TaxID=3364366 RepID=UPI0037C99038